MKKFLNRLMKIAIMLLLIVNRTPSFGIVVNAGKDVLRFNVDKFEVVGGFTVSNSWTIDKSANKSTLNLPIGGSENVGYTITVGKSSTAIFSMAFSFSVKNQGSKTETVSVSANVESPSGGLIYGPQPVGGVISIDPGTTYQSGTVVLDFTIPNFNTTKLTPFKVNLIITESSVPLVDISGSLSAAVNNVGAVTYTNQILTVTDSMPGVGPWTFENAGSVMYTKSLPAGSVGGTHTVDNTVIGTSDTTYITDSVTVTVNTINAKPIANNQSLVTNEDTPLSITLTGSDADAGQSISYVNVGNPSNGSLSGTEPSLIYTPNPDFNGTDSFTFRVFDGFEYSSYATITIQVNPIDDLPVANDDTATTDEDTPVDISVLLNDTDVDNDPITITGFTDGANGLVSDNGDGTLKYTPNLDFNGVDTFTYTINGGATATVTVTVNPVDDLPVANDDTATTDEDTPVDISVLLNDTDVENDPITITGFTDGTNGVVSDNGDGTLKYTPNLDFNGVDTFTYTINGGATATVTVTVNPVDDLPVANDDTASTIEDVLVVIDVIANDFDLENDPITVIGFTLPANGAVVDNLDGTFTYTPNAAFSGVDTFTYTINGGSTATVTVTVTAGPTPPPANLPPVAIGQSLTVITGGTLGGTVTGTDPENDPLVFSLLSGTANGSLAFNADGTFTYVHNGGPSTSDSFLFEVYDGTSTSNALVTITITTLPTPPPPPAANIPPVVVNGTVTTDFETPISGQVSGSDADGDPLSFSLVTGTTNGTLVFNPDGSFTYTPNDGFNGSDSFTFNANDGTVDSNIATFTINVSDEEVVVVEEEETPLVALPFDWFSWLAYLLAGLLAWLLAFLRPNMKYTLTDGSNNQKVIRRRLAKPDEKTMIVELNDKDMVNLQTINVEFYKRLAKHCGEVTVNFQLNGKVVHSVVIPEGIDESFETLIRL